MTRQRLIIAAVVAAALAVSAYLVATSGDDAGAALERFGRLEAARKRRELVEAQERMLDAVRSGRVAPGGVFVEEPSVSGGIDGAAVRRALEAEVESLAACWPAGALRREDGGEARVSFELDREGQARDVRAGGLPALGSGGCLSTVIESLPFAPGPAGTVSVKLLFAPP